MRLLRHPPKRRLLAMPASRGTLARLDSQYRQRRIGFGTSIARYILEQWFRLIVPTNIKGIGTLRWLELVLPRIEELYQESVTEAITYATQVRALQVPNLEPVTYDRPTFEPEKVRKSLLYMGPTNLALSRLQVPRPIPNEDPIVEDIEERAIERKLLVVNRKVADQVAAAAVRHVRNGDRDAVDLAVKKDAVALGWVRITQPGACYFCLMLQSRGGVYKEDSFAASDPRFAGKPGSGDYKVHDSCACSLRALYTRDREEWPEEAIQADELWRSSTSGLSGNDAVNAFRRSVEGRTV